MIHVLILQFLVMSLVGKSLDDLRKNIVGKNFSKSTGMQCAYQTLVAIGDLHDIGYLHRCELFLFSFALYGGHSSFTEI